MPHGHPDEFLANARRAIRGARQRLGPPAPDWQKRVSPNHAVDLAVGGYGLDPHGPWRGEVMRLLREQREGGLWALRASDELGTGSHCAHWYAAQDSLLLLAHRLGDEEVRDAVMVIERGVHAIESLCVVGSGRLAHIVMPGARCWIGPRGKGGADQRAIRDLRWQSIQGWPRRPLMFETADDWLGAFALHLLADEPGGAVLLADINRAATVAVDGHLPTLRNSWRIERGPHGHVAVMETWTGAAHPALYAAAIDGDEEYGCDGNWAAGHEPSAREGRAMIARAPRLPSAGARIVRPPSRESAARGESP